MAETIDKTTVADIDSVISELGRLSLPSADERAALYAAMVLLGEYKSLLEIDPSNAVMGRVGFNLKEAISYVDVAYKVADSAWNDLSHVDCVAMTAPVARDKFGSFRQWTRSAKADLCQIAKLLGVKHDGVTVGSIDD